MKTCKVCKSGLVKIWGSYRCINPDCGKQKEFIEAAMNLNDKNRKDYKLIDVTNKFIKGRKK